MMKRLFGKLYKNETRAIRPDAALGRKLRREIGLGSPMSHPFRFLVPAGATLLVAVIAVVTLAPHQTKIATTKIAAVIDGGRDDWRYSPATSSSNGSYGGSSVMGLSGGVSIGLGNATGIGLGSAPAAMAPRAKLGLAVGGAKDVVTFRENILNKYLPKSSSLTPEGLFGEYFFDLSTAQECAELFCPTYLRAVSPDPLSGEETRYLAVGLDSNMDAASFARKPLDLVAVLDISGSMGEGMANYYYDDPGRSKLDELEPAKTKIQAATESIAALMDHLRPEDRFGVVVFDDAAVLAKPLTKVGDTDMASIKGHVLELAPRGGTNIESGMREADTLFDEIESETGRERRMIVLTDAMPNRGNYGTGDFTRIMEANAARRVYTTFIGIGLDFQTDLVEAITKVRGANYHSVFTVKEFADRMDKNFDYMVTPVVFDLKLRLEAPGYAIEKVYGSPEADEATGELMRVRTLFPSETDARGTRGGIVVLRLKKTGDNEEIKLAAEYTDTDGAPHDNRATATFSGLASGSSDNAGIRKGVLLSRYGDLLKTWIADELRLRNRGTDAVPMPMIDAERGILPYPDQITWPISQWEQGSVPLTVSPEYRASFTTFRAHLESEMSAIGDEDLRKELTLIDKILATQ